MKRKEFLHSLFASSLMMPAMKLKELETLSSGFAKSPKMPLLFIGHGHPMNALMDNSFTQALQKLGKDLPVPNAVMVVSAHWETRGTYVSVNPWPKAIYDFGRFDDRLFGINYAPAGHPGLAEEALKLLPSAVGDPDMGLDHGAWTVLRFIFPEANIPVFQLSIDLTQPTARHFELGQALGRLREKGVLVMGSGNIVHNLRRLDWHNIEAATPDWAAEFDQTVKNHLDSGNFAPLANYRQFGGAALAAVPTEDHYLPMLYTLGMAGPGEPVRYLYEGFQYGSISMRCFQIG